MYVPNIGPFIFHALKNSDSSDTIKNAWGLISDLWTMVESQSIISAFEEYVPLLHGIMAKRNLHRYAKLSAVTAIGDTYLMTKDKFFPFLDSTLKLFSSAANQCIDVNLNDDDLVLLCGQASGIINRILHLYYSRGKITYYSICRIFI